MSWQAVVALLGAFGAGGVVGAVVEHFLAGRRERRSFNVEQRRTAYARIDEMATRCKKSLDDVAYGTEKSLLRREIAEWPWEDLRKALHEAQRDFDAPRAQFRLTVSDKVASALDGLAGLVQAGVILLEAIYSSAYWVRNESDRRSWPPPIYEPSGRNEETLEALEAWVRATGPGCERVAAQFSGELVAIRKQMKRELGTAAR